MPDPQVFKKYREALVVIGVALVGAFIAKKAYDVQLDKVRVVRESIRREEQKAQTLDRIIVLNERLKELKKSSWPSTDFASVVDVVSRIGEETGLRVSSISPVGKTEETYLISISFFITAEATYRDLAKFLLAVRSLPELLYIQEVTLTPGGEKREGAGGVWVSLALNIKGSALYLK